MEKTQKTNKPMRIALSLLVVAILTTCLVGGTFAKYATQGSAADTARIAKWGIELSATGDSFDVSYANGSNAITVKSGSTDKLVAPGTVKASAGSFSIKGKAESAVKVEMGLGTTSDVFLKAATGKYYDFTSATADDTFDLASDYYPVVFTLEHTYGAGAWSIAPAVTASTGATVTSEGSHEKGGTDTVTGTLAQINAVLANLQNSMTEVDPNYTFDDTFKLSWAWDFDANGAGTHDAADTVLGNLADGDTVEKTGAMTAGTDYCLTESYDFSIKVTQVD